MDTSAFDHLPESLRQKVIEANQAYALAAELSQELAERFAIDDLQVAMTTGQVAAVSGSVASEEVRQSVTAFLLQSGKVSQVHNGLMVVPGGS